MSPRFLVKRRIVKISRVCGLGSERDFLELRQCGEESWSMFMADEVSAGLMLLFLECLIAYCIVMGVNFCTLAGLVIFDRRNLWFKNMQFI